PIGHLFEYLEKGETLTEFLRQFPSVTHEQALGVLELSKESLLANHEMLLDECVVRDLKKDLAEHEVSTVVEAGFGGLENGQLLRAAAGRYDVLITVDRNLPFQQN